ncbi:MAG: PQQ-binding-like beta-propeller repeat protein [Deltaproteobacteria bacterium]|nr:PQQ-binding-like beta-propeller repeat protein [Deltaproteobacteria bacterium]
MKRLASIVICLSLAGATWIACSGGVSDVPDCSDDDGDGYAAGPDCEGAIDCDDGDASRHPDAEELCDGIDNDCDDQVDEGCGSCTDGDGDGYFLESGCGGEPDCDDGDASRHPGAEELCDGTDNDCDQQVDEGCGTCTDGDGDGYFLETGCGSEPDCDDGARDSHPGAEELCDGRDNDCDQQTDEELGQTRCGLGACEHAEDNCVDGQPNECDPMRGSSPEECDGVDDDCDGVTDNGAICDSPSEPCRQTPGLCEGGQCSYALAEPGSDCEDGDMCTAGDACDADGGCSPGDAVDCDDGRECTEDRCDPHSGCIHERAQPTIRWSVSFAWGNFMSDAPALDGGGRIVVPGTGKLSVFRPDGQLDWEYELPDAEARAAVHTPIVSSGGLVLVVDDARTAWALDADGVRQWRTPLDSELEGSTVSADPVLLDESTLLAVVDYQGSSWRYDAVVAVGLDGQIGWTRTELLRGMVPRTGAVSAAGRLFIGDDDGLSALDSAGEQVWRNDDVWRIHDGSTAAIGDDGTVYIADNNHHTLYALDPADGEIRWEFDDGTCCQAEFYSPSVGPDGTIYAGFKDDDAPQTVWGVYAVSPAGVKAWFTPTDGPVTWPPAVDAEGSIYVAAEGSDTGSPPGTLYALGPDGSVLWTLAIPVLRAFSPLIADDGTVYVLSDYDWQSTYPALHAVDACAAPLASSGWPRYHRDNQNTGRQD